MNNTIATDASVSNEKAGADIFSRSLDWFFSVRLPDYIPIFIVALFDIVLALRKLPLVESEAVVIADSFSVCAALSSGANLTLMHMFRQLMATNLQKLQLLWVPGHRGLYLNEMADALETVSLSGPLIPILPHTAYATTIRFRNLCLQEINYYSLDKIRDFAHLRCCWNRQWCATWQLEVAYTRLRCSIPQKNYYFYIVGLKASPLCQVCEEIERINHFVFFCHRYSYQRKRYQVAPLKN